MSPSRAVKNIHRYLGSSRHVAQGSPHCGKIICNPQFDSRFAQLSRDRQSFLLASQCIGRTAQTSVRQSEVTESLRFADPVVDLLLDPPRAGEQSNGEFVVAEVMVGYAECRQSECIPVRLLEFTGEGEICACEL